MTANWIVPRRARRAVPASWAPGWGLPSIDEFFNELWGGDLRTPDRTSAFFPKVDIEGRDGELRLTVELPGLEDKDFEVTIDGDLLTIKGEKKLEREVSGKAVSVVERADGSFERGFRVAWDVDPESVKASFKNGVLEVVIPRPEAEQSQVRSIPVTSS